PARLSFSRIYRNNPDFLLRKIREKPSDKFIDQRTFARPSRSGNTEYRHIGLCRAVSHFLSEFHNFRQVGEIFDRRNQASQGLAFASYKLIKLIAEIMPN